MSRKKSSLNSPHHHKDHTQESQANASVVEQISQWQQLWGKLILNGHQSHQESEERPETPPPAPAHKPSYLKLLLKLLSQLTRRQKNSFDPKQLQREILEDIGQQLYYERQKQGLTLDVIALETRISVGVLRAIEKGRLQDLPEAIYTRSFIKKFADFLGLDGKSLAESFPLDIISKSSGSSRFRFWLPVLQFRPIHLYFLYIIIVVLSVQTISNHLKQAALEGVNEELAVPVAVTPSPSEPVKKPVRVKVHSKGKSNIKVLVDGKTVFQGVLAKETQKTWEADKNITVEASNAGLILLTFNDQKTQRFGKLGENKKVTYQLTKVSQ